MKKFISICLLLITLLLFGCAASDVKTDRRFSWKSFDETEAVYPDVRPETKRPKSAQSLPDRGVWSKINPQGNGRNVSDRYFTGAFLAPGTNSLETVMSDGQIIFPDNNQNRLSLDGSDDLYPYLSVMKTDHFPKEAKKSEFTLALEKTDEADFKAFEDEFKDIKMDTRQKDTFDPLIGYNRLMYNFNDKLYFWVLRPIAKGYRAILHEDIREALNRFFKNLSFPLRFANNALQGKFKRAGIETARFGLNSTLGVVGFSDPALELFNLQPYEEDFGQTLGRYGVGDGFPLVLPFLGPYNLRDAIGLIPDIFFYPIRFLDQSDSRVINPTFVGIWVFETVNRTSLRIGVYENLKKDALDPYVFFRDAYKQNRDAKIKE